MENEPRSKAKEIEAENNVQLLTTIEQNAKQKGMQQGMQQGEVHLLKKQLLARFSEVPSEYTRKLEAADVETLDYWALNILYAKSLEDVFKTKQ